MVKTKRYPALDATTKSRQFNNALETGLSDRLSVDQLF